MKNNNSKLIFVSIVGLISILLNIGIYFYIKELEKDKCLCSDSLLRDIVKYGSLIFVVYLVIINLLNLFTNILKNSKVFNVLSYIVNLTVLVYFICCVVYYFKLVKKMNCDCSYDWKRKLLVYPLIILPFMILGLIILMFLLLKGRPLPMNYEQPSVFPSRRKLRRRRA